MTLDAQGNVYGADFLMDVRKFVLTRAADELRARTGI